MPTFSTSPSSGDAARHAAPPDRERLHTFLAISWASLHLPVLALLGLAVQRHVDAMPDAPAATVPDLPNP
ncbi:hypothetical protein [Streptomyces sp. Y1]|uniref:Uncharacterized protein n=1 Tax=Streptomyces sp. Y1 TaxID=3238634 RepID=A0AB39TXL7_9ACTN